MTDRPSITEAEFFEIVEAICKRPRMYTHRGSFDEVCAFLEGYGAAANVGAKGYHSVFTPFHNWWRMKFGVSREDFDASWNIFRDRYASDEEAVTDIAPLYAEYVRSMTTLL